MDIHAGGSRVSKPVESTALIAHENEMSKEERCICCTKQNILVHQVRGIGTSWGC